MSRPNFADKIVCVSFSASCFGTTLTDEEATESLHKQYDAREGSKVVKDRLKEMMAPIQKEIRRARKLYRESTFPGLTSDLRIIPFALLPNLRTQVQDFRTKIDAAFDVEIPRYGDHLEKEKTKHQKLFKRSDYPEDPEMLRETVELRLMESDLPRGEFQRIAGIQQAEVDRMQAEFNRRVQEIGSSARNEVYANMVRLITHIHEKLNDPEAKHYYESTFQNLKDYLALVPDLNITGDARLEQMREACLESLNYTMEEVKNSAWQKTVVSEAAKEILQRFGNMGSGRKILAV